MLNVKYFYSLCHDKLKFLMIIKNASGLLGGAGFRRITSPGEKYFIGCEGGEQSANQRAGGGYQNPDTENCGKRDRVGEV